MMQRALLFASLMLAAPLVGCIGDSGTTDDPLDAQSDLASTVPDVTWASPQTTSHPAFGFPTVNDPTSGLDGAAPTWWTPPEPVELPEEITGLEHKATVNDGEQRGAGIALFGSLAIVPGFADPTSLFDISDPSNPVHLSDLGEPPARDVDTIAYPDGTLVAVFATDAGVVPVWDITDPENPEHLVDIEPTAGSHNVAIVPGTPILLNANSNGGGSGSQIQGQGTGLTEIFDLSDPANPEHVQDWGNGYGCHDISFYIDPAQEMYRAYCAGVDMTQIWGVADPASPTVITDVPYPQGAGPASIAAAPAALSHLAMVNHDASVLIVGDETGGGVAPACDAYARPAGTTISGPIGNLWFYDLSDEQNPELMGWMSPTHHYTNNPPHDDRFTEIGGLGVPAGCTAHFGRVLEDTNVLAIAFYGAGVLLIDFDDPANPEIIAQHNDDNPNVWDVWYYQGYLFTGDLARGLDVFTLT